MIYVYQSFERGLWTVGFYRPDGTWNPEGDYTCETAAASRVHYLNGGNTPELLAALKAANNYGKPGTTEDGIDVQYLLEKAIAKAEGGAR